MRYAKGLKLTEEDARSVFFNLSRDYRIIAPVDKIYDFRKRTGVSMCVGCGRCDNVCPEYISMFNCVRKINRISEALSEQTVQE